MKPTEDADGDVIASCVAYSRLGPTLISRSQPT
jgi:hypothetical protein